jgi:hypothetical protein
MSDSRIKFLMEENARLKNAIEAINELIDQSEGVSGLHLNGNLAPWDELTDNWLNELKIANDWINSNKIHAQT